MNSVFESAYFLSLYIHLNLKGRIKFFSLGRPFIEFSARRSFKFIFLNDLPKLCVDLFRLFLFDLRNNIDCLNPLLILVCKLLRHDNRLSHSTSHRHLFIFFFPSLSLFFIFFLHSLVDVFFQFYDSLLSGVVYFLFRIQDLLSMLIPLFLNLS